MAAMRHIVLGGVLMAAIAANGGAWAITQRPETKVKSSPETSSATEPVEPTAERMKAGRNIRIPEDVKKQHDKKQKKDRLPDWSNDSNLDDFLQDTLTPQM